MKEKYSFLKIYSHYILFKGSFIADYSVLKDYNLKVYQKNDLEANMTFPKSLKLETL